MNEQDLDRILEAMHAEDAAPETVAAAQERVWRNLQVNPSCMQFREQFTAARAGELGEARQMLFDDHMARCADCRRAFGMAEPEKKPVVVAMPARKSWIASPAMKWAVAAGLAIAAVYVTRDRFDAAFAPSGPRATVEAVSGQLYALNGAGLGAGATLEEGLTVRTGADSRAFLRLADGSRVEMNQRTDLSMKAAWSGLTVQLQRGDIIVEAAKQRRGGLRVVTRDAEASVKGTVFTVSTGVAGSLVGVVEGSVAVSKSGGDVLLTRGQRAHTGTALEKVTVRDAVAWSGQADKHFELLGELAAIEKQITPATPRVQAKLLELLPPDTVVYAAIPNLGGAVKQAVEMIEQRSAQSEVLRQWWNSPGAGYLKKASEQIQAVSPMIGEEIVFLLAAQSGSKQMTPLMMAHVKSGQEAALAEAIRKAIPEGARASYAFRAENGLFLLTHNEAALSALIPTLGQGAQAPFARELAGRYSRGVSWLLAANLEAMAKAQGGNKAAEAMGVQYLVLEQRTVGGREENEVVLSFTGERAGLAGILAEAASLGSAEYVSADAVLAISAGTRKPGQVFEELAARMSKFDKGLTQSLAEAEAKAGINISTELAGAIGTDFTFAIETPTLPIPGVVIAVEVLNPPAFDGAVQKLAERFNAELEPGQEGRKLNFVTETAEGRSWNSLQVAGPLLALHWTYDRGYLIAGLERGQVTRAIATRTGGFPLVRSAKFRDQLPSATGLHPSGFVWANLGANAGALNLLAGSSPTLQRLIATKEASLLTFTGERERIRAASRTRMTSLLLDTLAGSESNPRTTKPANASRN
jgi:hypothetical protein